VIGFKKRPNDLNLEGTRVKVNEYQQLAMTTLNPALNNNYLLINSVMGLCF